MPVPESSPTPGAGTELPGPVEALVEVVEEATTPDPPAWSRHLADRARRFDESADGLVDHLRGRPVIDRVMYSITELADFSLLWHLIASSRGLRSDRHAAEAVRLMAVLGAESTLVNAGIKSLFRRERPIPEFERPHHLRIPLTTSFPSGHASAAFCAATLLSERATPGAAAAWYGLATLVATSRVHVKIHHGSDVVGGVVVGLVVGRAARHLWRLRAAG